MIVGSGDTMGMGSKDSKWCSLGRCSGWGGGV